MVKVLNDNNFVEEIKNANVPVLVDFYADWCGPCKMAAPMVEQISNEVEGKAIVCKINVDQNPEISAQLGISSIPCFMVFKNGKLANRQVGFSGKESIKKMLD